MISVINKGFPYSGLSDDKIHRQDNLLFRQIAGPDGQKWDKTLDNGLSNSRDGLGDRGNGRGAKGIISTVVEANDGDILRDPEAQVGDGAKTADGQVIGGENNGIGFALFQEGFDLLGYPGGSGAKGDAKDKVGQMEFFGARGIAT